MKLFCLPAYKPRGATMLLVMMFAIIGGIAVTAWMYLMGARLQQAAYQANEVQRHLIWGNSAAINQQYGLQFSFQDNVTRSASTALLNSDAWGGSAQDAYSSLQAFRTTKNYSTPQAYAYPFNNIRPNQTPDGSVLYTRTTGDSDNSQSEHLAFYDYQKSYPSPLLGDLLLVHTRPAGATGTVTLSNDIQVNGRVVIWEPNAATQNVRAQECLNLNHTATNTTDNYAGTALLLPDNYSATTRITAGTGGTSSPAAVTDGTLNMVNNANFPPGSVQYLMGSFTPNNGPSTGPLGQVLGLVGGLVGGLVNLNALVPGITYPVQTQQTYLNNLQLAGIQGPSMATLLPPLAGNLSLLNIGIVVVNDPNVPNVEFTGSINLVIVVGQLLPTGLSSTASLAPLYIWVDQASQPRHVIFLGESLRPVIFVTGAGYGQDTYVASVGVTSLLGAPLQWRLHWINQYTHLHIVPPLLFGSWQITGSLRTNWSVDCTDTSGANLITFQRDTDATPGTLAKVMPRDAWFEPYFMVR